MSIPYSGLALTADGGNGQSPSDDYRLIKAVVSAL